MLKEHLTESAQEVLNSVPTEDLELLENAMARVLRWQMEKMQGEENVLEHTESGLDLGNSWFDEFPILEKYFDRKDFQIGFTLHDAGEAKHAKGRDESKENRAVLLLGENDLRRGVTRF